MSAQFPYDELNGKADLRQFNIKHSVVKRIINDQKSYNTEVQQIRDKIENIESNRQLVSESGEDLNGELKRWNDVLDDTLQMVPDAAKRLAQSVRELKDAIEGFTKKLGVRVDEIQNCINKQEEKDSLLLQMFRALLAAVNTLDRLGGSNRVTATKLVPRDETEDAAEELI